MFFLCSFFSRFFGAYIEKVFFYILYLCSFCVSVDRSIFKV